MRLPLGLVFASASLFGQFAAVPQFRQLATTDDGSRVYFSSPLPLLGAADAGPSKIFVLGNSGLHLFAEQDTYPLGWPSASGDGGVVAFSGVVTGKFQANVALGNGAVFWTSAGQAGLSRNGRFALLVPDGSGSVTVVNLADGSSFSMTADGPLLPLSTGGRSIASDGTAVVRAANAIQVVGAAGVQSFPLADAVNSAVMDDGPTTVAYEAAGQIVLLDLASGAATAAVSGTAPCLTNDGQTLLYLAPDANGTTQAWLAARDGSGVHALTAVDSGVAEAVISGDGSTVYAIASNMRLLRIDVASGTVTDLTPGILAAAAPAAPRVASLTVTPAAIAPGASAQLCYSVEGAASVSIQPAFGVVPPTSACLTVNPTNRTTYTLTAANDAGSNTASATLDVSAVRILTFSNDPAYSPASGSAVTLSWTTENASFVRITGLGLPAATLAVNGSTVVNPVTNTTYTLTAYGVNGQAVSSVLYVFVR